MPGRSQNASGATPSTGATDRARCAFCNDPVSANEAKLFGAELLCKDCMHVALSAQRAHKPLSKIAKRAAEIDTAAMATNRIAFTAVISIISLGGIAIGAVLVNHAMKDTWERDNAARVLELSAEARNLDETEEPQAALATYDELLSLVGDHTVKDEELQTAISTARERRQALGAALAANTQRQHAEEQRQAEAAKQRRERRLSEQRAREEKKRQEELAQQREQERREQEAQEKPIAISDLGLKLVDSSPDMDFCTYSWKATITNHTARSVTLTVVLTLYDKDGFELESDYQFGVVIGAGQSKTVTGKSMTKLSTYEQVTKYGVNLQ